MVFLVTMNKKICPFNLILLKEIQIHQTSNSNKYLTLGKGISVELFSKAGRSLDARS